MTRQPASRTWPWADSSRGDRLGKQGSSDRACLGRGCILDIRLLLTVHLLAVGHLGSVQQEDTKQRAQQCGGDNTATEAEGHSSSGPAQAPKPPQRRPRERTPATSVHRVPDQAPAPGFDGEPGLLGVALFGSSRPAVVAQKISTARSATGISSHTAGRGSPLCVPVTERSRYPPGVLLAIGRPRAQHPAHFRPLLPYRRRHGYQGGRGGAGRRASKRQKKTRTTRTEDGEDEDGEDAPAGCVARPLGIPAARLAETASMHSTEPGYLSSTVLGYVRPDWRAAHLRARAVQTGRGRSTCAPATCRPG